MVRESNESGQTVSMVVRRHGVNPNQLSHWRKLYQDGGLSAVRAGERVVVASELANALKQIRELQRMLGKKTMENADSARSEADGVSRLGMTRHSLSRSGNNRFSSLVRIFSGGSEPTHRFT